MKKLGINGFIEKIGQDVEFYGEIVKLEYYGKSSTPYVRIYEVINGRRIKVKMPFMPGDVIGVQKQDGEFEEVVFTGEDKRWRYFEYEPFGVKLKS